ncbi:MAG: hypothetical protein KME45_15230 [Stenomitos rutilans HA7619-LM2]|jgi:hypothetical protein|nr:hypothetical protein [Stenomitos rutilans HA7619-LM2]
MTDWSPIKFHPKNGQYYRYQESGQTIRLLEAIAWEALEPDSPDSHHHYFKINGRWYVYADTPNHSLLKQPTVAGIDSVNPSNHLDKLLNELKHTEPFRLGEPEAKQPQAEKVPGRTY